MTVARSSRRHKLVTEASKRFERGVDPALPPAAAQLAVDLLVEHGGGDRRRRRHRRRRRRAAPTAYVLDVALPPGWSGVDYPRERVVEILRDLGCAVDDDGGPDDTSAVTPPSWRPDLVDAPDYAEEVARIDGYDKIPSIVPHPAGGPRADPRPAALRRIVADALAGAGSHRGADLPVRRRRSSPTRSGCRPTTTGGTRSGVANPLSDEAPLLRTSVLSSARRRAAPQRRRRGRKDVALFEIGLVFRPGRRAAQPRPSPASTAAPTTTTLAELYAAVPAQPRRVGRRRWPARRSRPAGGARAAPPTGRTPSRRSGRGARALGVEVAWPTADRARAVAPRPLRAHHRSPTAPSSGTPASCTRRSLAALDLPARTVRRSSSTSTCSSRASAEPVQAAPVLDLPAGLTDVALLVAADVPAADVEAALRSGAGELARVGRALRRLRGRAGRGRAHRSLAYRADASARPTGPSRPRRSTPSATRRWRPPARRRGRPALSPSDCTMYACCV